ncbi:glycolipid transfer protein domain-containing protein 2 isoform X2 [Ascaphus truei]|uniref:glycolipid transfer protein domain-containing protein 2 isoform X2 n=1 Tax=Ascaphus truei TaxID=8439 RepID=UPI003F591FD9
MAPRKMGYPKILRLALPLALVFLLLYLSASKLHVHLYACVQDGRPCIETAEDASVRGEIKVRGTPSLEEGEREVHAAEEYRKHCEGKDFQIGRMIAAFRACVTEEGDVLLEEYLNGWRELIKFMDALGTVFTFISHETMTKINILHGYLSRENGPSYRTITSMVKHELENGVVNFKELPSNQVPSGCRTLLRLHRALKWLELFLYKLGTSHGQEQTSDLCAKAYHQALAHHHSWFIRQVAEVAFLALPPLEEMYEVVCVRDHGEAKVVLLTTVEAIVKVYNITQKVYAENRMLDLP